MTLVTLIHERRFGEYHLPAGSIVIGAGNRAQDNAIVKPMSSALLNRMVRVHLAVSSSRIGRPLSMTNCVSSSASACEAIDEADGS